MTLKEFMKRKQKKPLVFLWFEKGVLKTEFKPNENLLKMTVMDINEEEDCLEVWLK